MKKTILILALVILPGIPVITQAADDFCLNYPGIQDRVPFGFHAGPDTTCIPDQEPVVIDVAPPGSEPVVIDIVPPQAPGSSILPEAKQIDVNPVGYTPSVSTASKTASDGSVVSASTTPKTVITSIYDLNTYIFDPGASKEEKIALIESRIKVLLQEIINILTLQIEEIIKNKKK